MAKKKEPTFWSTSCNGQTNGSSYAQRNKRKQASGQGCMVLLVIGASLVASLGYFVQGWVL